MRSKVNRAKEEKTSERDTFFFFFVEKSRFLVVKDLTNSTRKRVP
jgi:hypothetical protein